MKEPHVEELLKDDKIDMIALSTAKFRHPFRHWLRVKYLILKDKTEEMIWKLVNAMR
jgi:hypothetical protein